MREDSDMAMRLQVEGISQASAARAIGISPSTIVRWRERGTRHVRVFEQEDLVVEDPVELQIDELCARGRGSPPETWLYNGLEVWSRV